MYSWHGWRQIDILYVFHNKETVRVHSPVKLSPVKIYVLLCIEMKWSSITWIDNEAMLQITLQAQYLAICEVATVLNLLSAQN